MKWFRKIWLGLALVFLFVLPASSKYNKGKGVTARVNAVRKSIRLKDLSNTQKGTVLEIKAGQFRKDWVNWSNWGNWANWNNWNNWRNWNNWSNWADWGNY